MLSYLCHTDRSYLRTLTYVANRSYLIPNFNLVLSIPAVNSGPNLIRVPTRSAACLGPFRVPVEDL